MNIEVTDLFVSTTRDAGFGGMIQGMMFHEACCYRVVGLEVGGVCSATGWLLSLYLCLPSRDKNGLGTSG